MMRAKFLFFITNSSFGFVKLNILPIRRVGYLVMMLLRLINIYFTYYYFPHVYSIKKQA